MTDKEIIINGVNVAGCEFLQKMTTIEGNIDYVCRAGGDCKLKPYCYYQKKEKEMIANAFMKAYNKHLKELNPWKK